jgi:hypothetical protein
VKKRKRGPSQEYIGYVDVDEEDGRDFDSYLDEYAPCFAYSCLSNL